jgi:hypothetical protein
MIGHAGEPLRSGKPVGLSRCFFLWIGAKVS